MAVNVVLNLFAICLAFCGVLGGSAPSDVHIMLIGRTGHGKSSTGNSILMKPNYFATSDDADSKTKEAQLGTSINDDGVTLSVVDTPGLIDTKDMREGTATKNVMKHLKHAMSISPRKGVSAFIYVLNYASPRFTSDDLRSLQILERSFSPGMFEKFGIVLFTNKDNFIKKHGDMSFKDWCKRQKQPDLRQLLEKVKYRCIAFENYKPSVGQRQELLEMIQTMNPGGERYTDSLFIKAAEERIRLLAEENVPHIDDVIEDKLEMIKAEFERGFDRSNDLSSEDYLFLLIFSDATKDSLNDIIGDIQTLQYPDQDILLKRPIQKVKGALKMIERETEYIEKKAQAIDKGGKLKSAIFAGGVSGLIPFLKAGSPLFSKAVGKVLVKTGENVAQTFVNEAARHTVKKATESIMSKTVSSLTEASIRSGLYNKCGQDDEEEGWVSYIAKNTKCVLSDPATIVSLGASLVVPGGPLVIMPLQAGISYMFDKSVDENKALRLWMRQLASDDRRRKSGGRVNILEKFKIEDY